MLGFCDRARRRTSEWLEAAKRSNDMSVLATAYVAGTDVYYYCGAMDAVKEHVSTFRRLRTTMESEYPQWIGGSALMEGWLIAEQGNPQAGLDVARCGFELLLTCGSRISMPLFGAQMASAEARAGKIDEALKRVDWTLRIADETGQHFFDSELHRLRGGFLLACEPRGNREAEQCFRTALETARRQSAKSWELRAVTSLARLLDRQGHRDEAREMLGDIYGWFTEGFDTRDLREAKALLTELKQRPRRAHA
jgi:predicted ATPase